MASQPSSSAFLSSFLSNVSGEWKMLPSASRKATSLKCLDGFSAKNRSTLVWSGVCFFAICVVAQLEQKSNTQTNAKNLMGYFMIFLFFFDYSQAPNVIIAIAMTVSYTRFSLEEHLQGVSLHFMIDQVATPISTAMAISFQAAMFFSAPRLSVFLTLANSTNWFSMNCSRFCSMQSFAFSCAILVLKLNTAWCSLLNAFMIRHFLFYCCSYK